MHQGVVEFPSHLCMHKSVFYLWFRSNCCNCFAHRRHSTSPHRPWWCTAQSPPPCRTWPCSWLRNWAAWWRITSASSTSSRASMEATSTEVSLDNTLHCMQCIPYMFACFLLPPCSSMNTSHIKVLPRCYECCTLLNSWNISCAHFAIIIIISVVFPRKHFLILTGCFFAFQIRKVATSKTNLTTEVC